MKTLLKGQRTRPSSTSDAQTDKDRLFDVRVHGLPLEKKRELEQLLRNFATTVTPGLRSDKSASSATHGSAGLVSEVVGASDSRQAAKPLHADSGYGSNTNANSNSGLTSAAVSSGGKQAQPISKSSRNKNIKNYLHDIPDVLLPRQQSLFMSERAKMALVVRRLEQLFTGKQAAPGEHSQPIQQQEVSHSAAKADAQTQGPSRPAEGSREAYIQPHDTQGEIDVPERQDASPRPSKMRKLKHEVSDSSSGENVESRPASPYQRPTRPLDLDIHREQVVSENIDYIRHLGFSSPKLDQATDDPSWMYLNLLIGMAQLHTLNVTPAFVRQAIKKRSTKFELSGDGHRVRWTGGTEGTAFSKEEERAMEATTEVPSDSNEDSGRSSKRSKTEGSSNAVVSEEPSSGIKSGLQTSATSYIRQSISATSNLQTSLPVQPTPPSAFDYKPLFYKGKNYAIQESYLNSPDDSTSSSGDSHGLAQALSRSNLSQRRQSDEGMITFFNNPFFCSDASADHAPVNWKPQREVVPWQTLGLDREVSLESPLRHHDACYFTPQFAKRSVDVSANEQLLAMPITTIRTAGEDETRPMELQASGLGGVTPEDNFALDVKIARSHQTSRKEALPSRVPFTGNKKRKRFSYEGVSCQLLELRPSQLPPPSYVFFTTSSSSQSHDASMMDDSDGSESSSSADEQQPPPPAFLNRWSSGSSDVESDEGDADDSSVDMLEMARAADPDRIAAQEREYMITHPGPGNAVDGSLAATVGASGSSVSGSDAGIDSDGSEYGSLQSESDDNSMDVNE